MVSDTSSVQLVRTSVLAGMVGAILALLFAPRSGKATRQTLLATATRLKHTTRHHLQPSGQSSVYDENNRSRDQESIRQEQLHIKREPRPQSPILTNWEQEL